jgi:hypothetical protein
LVVFTDNAELAALLTRGLILPAIELETALDEDGAAFLAVLGRGLRGASPKGNIDIGGLLTAFSSLRGEGAVHGDADIRDSLPLGGVFDFRITGDIPDNHHFIEVGHRSRKWGVKGYEGLRLKTISREVRRSIQGFGCQSSD